MITFDHLRKLALSFEATTEEPHFEKTSFRVQKKIFVTYDQKNHRACVKLSLADQDVFSVADTTIIYGVPNKWGTMGWTFIEMNTVLPELFDAAITSAYCEVAPKKFAEKYKPE